MKTLLLITTLFLFNLTDGLAQNKTSSQDSSEFAIVYKATKWLLDYENGKSIDLGEIYLKQGNDATSLAAIPTVAMQLWMLRYMSDKGFELIGYGQRPGYQSHDIYPQWIFRKKK